MLYRNKKPNDPNAGKWVGIGGRIEAGETPEECNLREVREETGLRLRSAHFHGIIHFRSDEWEDEDMYLFSSDDFESDSGETAFHFNCDEGDLAWIPDAELLSLPMWEGDKLFLPCIMDESNGFFSMKLVYEGDRLVKHTLYEY